jgi:hypothetical protein
MKKVRQTRLFSVALIAMFLVTSTLSQAVAGSDTGDFHSCSSFQTKSDIPYGSDQQFPFEEKEKEFEDKSESTGKDNTLSNFFFICEISCESPRASSDFNGISFFNSASVVTGSQVPLFLSKRTLLI